MQYIYGQNVIAKTTTLTLRIESNLKEALCTVTDRVHRSIANMIEMMLQDYCGREGVEIQEHEVQTPKGKRGSKINYEYQ